MRNNQLVAKIQKGLDEISPLINQKITPGSVRRINEITGQMVKAIDSRASRMNFVRRFLILLSLCALVSPAEATIDDAITWALQAIDPYVKQGYIARDDQWGGDLGLREQKAIPHTLFKGNDYWFCMGTDVDNARLAIHLYDSKGKIAENDAWQKGRFAGARVLAQATGTYYIIVEVTNSPKERTTWAMVYGYK